MFDLKTQFRIQVTCIGNNSSLRSEKICQNDFRRNKLRRQMD